MNNIGNNDDPDQLARRQAALAAQARARQVAGNIAAAHAAGVYNRARQNAVGYNPAQPGYVPPPPGHPLPPPPRQQAIPGIPIVGPPPPPPFAVGAMNALANVFTAMTAIFDTLTRRSGNDSRRRDGEVVVGVRGTYGKYGEYGKYGKYGKYVSRNKYVSKYVSRKSYQYQSNIYMIYILWHFDQTNTKPKFRDFL